MFGGIKSKLEFVFAGQNLEQIRSELLKATWLQYDTMVLDAEVKKNQASRERRA